jgi:hypothetical protein
LQRQKTRDKREREKKKKRERERERELAISSSLLFCRAFLCTVCSIPSPSLITNHYTEIHSLLPFSFPLGFAAIATEHAFREEEAVPSLQEEYEGDRFCGVL